MASAWGAAFGSAWGDSWGAIEAPGGEAPYLPSPGGGGAGSFHYPLSVIERLDLPEAVAEAIVEVAQQQEQSRQPEIDQTALLISALDALGIEWTRQYDEALTAYREAYRQQQIALAYEAARREDEYWSAAVTLLLLQ